MQLQDMLQVHITMLEVIDLCSYFYLWSKYFTIANTIVSIKPIIPQNTANDNIRDSIINGILIDT